MLLVIRYLVDKFINRPDGGKIAVISEPTLQSEVQRLEVEEYEETNEWHAVDNDDEEEEDLVRLKVVDDDDDDDDDQNLCQCRNGVITDLFPDYGLIDGKLKFNFTDLNVDHLSSGMRIQYMVFRTSSKEEWRVRRVLSVEEDWDAASKHEKERLLSKKIHIINRNEIGTVSEVNGLNVSVDRGYGVPTIKFSLGNIQSTFVPVKGDWLSINALVEVNSDIQDFGGEILNVQSIKPLRSKAANGVISHWDEKELRGAIDGTVWFSVRACREDYKPTVGDYVTFQAVECSFSVFVWRAVGVYLNDPLACKMKESKNLFNCQVPIVDDSEGRRISGRHSSETNKTGEEDNEIFGISIDNNLNFGIIAIGETRKIDVTLRNKGSRRHVLIRGRFHGRKRESQLIVCGLEDNLLIQPGGEVSFSFKCRGKFLGPSTEKFVFTFRGFKIVRHVEVDVHDFQMMNLISVEGSFEKGNGENNALARARLLREKETTVIRGIAPFRPPAFIPVRLDNYKVPEHIWDAVIGKNDEINSASHARRQLEDLIPSLRKELDFDNYCSNMHALLFLEEISQTTLLQKYNMENVEFTYAGPGMEYLALKIPGLSEGRPSLMVGDKLQAVDATKPGTAYEGYVHKICSKEVWLKFGSNFHAEYDGGPRSVSFVYGRSQMRRLHLAVDLALKNLGSDFLFPKNLKLQKPQLIITGKMTFEDNSIHEKFYGERKGISGKRFPQSQVDADGNDKNRGIRGLRQPAAPKTSTKPTDIHWFNSSLNHYQKLAVINVLGGEARPLPYIIFGPPGTGKTVTLVETILQIYELIPESRILVTTPSNSSANLIALRLLGSSVLKPGDLVRLVAFHLLDNDSVLPEALRPYATTADISQAASHQVVPLSRKLKPSSNAATIGRHRITVATCVSVGQLYSQGFPKGHFTHVCVDEAGQASEPEIMIALAFLHKDWGQAILAGDPEQLGPVVMSRFARHFKFDISFLGRLLKRYPYARDPCGFSKYGGFNPYLVTRLVMNYRSLPEILFLPSSLFYNNDLIPQVNEKNSREALVLKSVASILPKHDSPLPPAMVFHGIRGTNYQEMDSPSWFNPQEVVQVTYYLRDLLRLGITSDDIGVITPYQKQVHKVRELLSQINLPVPKIGSVEEFQGQERLIIILSAVRSCPKQLKEDINHLLGFVANRQRLNVALTRARALLIIVGDPWLLSRDPYWKQVLLYCLDQDAYVGCDVPPKFMDYTLESLQADFDSEDN